MLRLEQHVCPEGDDDRVLAEVVQSDSGGASSGSLDGVDHCAVDLLGTELHDHLGSIGIRADCSAEGGDCSEAGGTDGLVGTFAAGEDSDDFATNTFAWAGELGDAEYPVEYNASHNQNPNALHSRLILADACCNFRHRPPNSADVFPSR